MKKIYKFLIILIIIIIILYYINQYLNGWLIFILNNTPKYIAIIVGIIALMFPKDYDKLPEIFIYSYK
jgi:hypothetical protein